MQTKRERRATQSTVRIMTALALATWLCAGCGRTEKTESPPPEAPKSSEAEKWEPKTVEPLEEHSDHGHGDDHDHDHGGHTH